MPIVILIGTFLLGAILGSFINALTFRFNTGRSAVVGRSRCMHCRHELGFFDLVPILSYVLLQGRCRYCGAKISIQYPLVESAAALLALLVYTVHPYPPAFVFWLMVVLVLLFIVVYDIRHTIIPWSASMLLIALALFNLFVHVESAPIIIASPDLYNFIAGPVLAFPLILLSFISGGRWMGWGDGVLELSLGWLLGITAGFTALMLAFWIGAFVGIVLLILKRGFTIKSELPFAPFLIFGALIAHFFHVDFFNTLPLFLF
ncbi:MAG TPA: prepilin peptidase [Candidatus Paceibacterota bacterium]|nr:prepilin peptidase [Candidatus Paceibacterota bacterium]